MPSNLTSQYIKFTYRQLLHVSDGVTASLKTVYSGLGVATALKVSVGSVAVDNLKFDGNVISSTDTNGDITLTPDGTGKVNIGAINVTGGVITGITDLAIADGGTGASTAAGARDNLGLEIGVDIMAYYASQAYGRSLWNTADAVAARALLGINESGSTALLVANNLSDLADVPTAQINLQLEPGVDVQVWNANLDDWATKLSSDYATTSYVTSAISTAGGAYQPLDADLTAIAAAGSTAAGITILQFTDPNADRIMFWDDSAGAFAGLTLPAAGLSITATALDLANDLAALEGLASTGFAVRSATDTWVQRQLAAPAAGFTITNPAGIAGDPTFVLANDLAALEGLASTGFAVRSATDTWLQRSVAGTANEITVTNGDGVSGNPTISIPAALTFAGKTVTGGTFSGITLSGTIAGTPTFSGAIGFSSVVTVATAGTNTPLVLDGTGSQYQQGKVGGVSKYYTGTDGTNWLVLDSVAATKLTLNLSTGLLTLTGGLVAPTTLSIGNGNTGGVSRFLDINGADNTASMVRYMENGGNRWAVGRSITGSGNNFEVYSYTMAATVAQWAVGTGLMTLGISGTTTQALQVHGGVGGAGVVYLNATAGNYHIGLQTSGSTRGFIGSDSSNMYFMNSSTTALVYMNYTSGLLTTVGGLVTNGDIQISKATPTLDLIGTAPNPASILLRTNSRYDDIRNTSDGLSFRVNYSGTPLEMLLTTTGLQAKTRAGTTTTGTLVAADANTAVTLTGGITLPNSVFSARDMHVWHAGTSARTITRGSGVTMYVGGTNVATATLAANGVGGGYWSDASTVHLTGQIT